MNTQPTRYSALIENCLRDAEFGELPGYRRNKVRDTYRLPDRRRLLIATDRQSAFDQVLGVVPHKGQVLTQTARYWFDETADICPNHVISYPDPNVVLVKDLDMLPLEIVVRSYLTGSTSTSLWPSYARGERVLYGHTFPDGMVKNQQLDRPIITPTTKPPEGGHDEPVTEAEIHDIPAETLVEFSAKYVGLFERVTGLAFEAPDAETPVRQRIRRALAAELPAYFSDHGATLRS